MKYASLHFFEMAQYYTKKMISTPWREIPLVCDDLGNSYFAMKLWCAFHDTVLTNGAIPLEVMEELVDEWIAEVKAN